MSDKPKKALMFASVASMVDLFNRDNMNMLEELGCEVTVACNFKEGSVYSQDQAMNFGREQKKCGRNVMNVPVPRSMFDIKGMINTVRKLSKDMNKKQYDIIHCQSPIGGVLCRLAAMKSRKRGTKVLYYAHGFHFYKGAPLKNWLIFYTIERLCSRITDCQLTLNREDYKRAKKDFSTRVEYIPGVGMDIEDIDSIASEREAVCDELGIDPAKKIILSVCELSERKNCMTAIKAFIRADRDDAVLVMCGIGAQEEMLRKYVQEMGMEDKIIFAGFRNDIIRIYKAADIFIFTSKQEGLPVALMQAMATNLPVLCSDIRGNTDLVKNGRGGYMYDPMDIKGYTNGINDLLDNQKKCDRMGKINRKRVQRFDIVSVNNIMKSIYQSLLDCPE